ncbi:B-4DMT family transporter [Mycobacterium sp. E2699]|uniref:B-4DMT family transporter n=1 Tax=Mycobacterium sp. E2699 TaxID=1834137 RepID=UPI0018D4A89C|nr:B-4DMT family transporter [Mycobacterium sp. E2699]
MRTWMLRGLVFAAAMVVLRLLQGALINAWQTQAGLISVVLLILYVIGVVIWGVLDGRADAKAQPDPDRRQDLAMTWLLAGLFAGIVSGAVCWLIALFYQGLYTGGLINEVTTFAAFTALLVFVPGIIGVAVGRWRVDRNPPPRPRGADDERADTDVFSAVRGDETPTGEIPAQTAAGARAEERTGSVATAERDAPTETIPTAGRETRTEAIPTAGDDAKTEVIRTDDARHGKPGEEPEKG